MFGCYGLEKCLCREKYIEFKDILNISCKCFDITSLKNGCVEKSTLNLKIYQIFHVNVLTLRA